MGTLYKNIVVLCNKRNIKPGRVCNDLGLSRGLMTDLKMGRKKTVNAETAQKIANYFDVTVSHLLGWDNPENPIEFEVPISELEDTVHNLLAGEQKEKAPIDVVDEDLRDYLDELRNRPEMRMLFSTTKTATKAQIEAIVKMVEEMQGNK